MSENMHTDVGAALRRRCRLLSPDELSKLLNINKKTLATWRSKDKGPAYYKPMPSIVLYPEREALVWMTRNREKAESEDLAPASES